MDRKQLHKFRRFISDLAKIRGRHTELVSVFIPAGYELNKIISHLAQEQGTASNIKDARTRKNVIDSLERLIRHLRLFKETPLNGLAAFAGNCSETDNKVDIQVFSIEPLQALNMRLYRCDQYFHVQELAGMLDVKEVYGLIVMDNREATIGVLRGTAITVLKQLHSGVPGKIKAGGQCLATDSIVQLADGNLVPIQSMHNPLVVKSFNFITSAIEDSPVLDKWDTTQKELVRVITQSPRLEVDASPDHTFFVYARGKVTEKTCAELHVGDYLLMPEKMDIQGNLHVLRSDFYNSYHLLPEGQLLLRETRLAHGFFQERLGQLIGKSQQDIYQYEHGKQGLRPTTLHKLCAVLGLSYHSFILHYAVGHPHLKLPLILEEEVAQILGYFLGDGSFDDSRLCFVEQHEDVALHYQKNLQNTFSCKTHLRFRMGKNYYELRAYGRPLLQFLQTEFPELKKALDSHIPQKIFTSPNRVLASFIRGLFDAEGYVSTDEIGIGMNNKRIIRELQMLLLRLGIISSFGTYDNRGNPYSKNIRYTVRIIDRVSLVHFKEHVGFTFLTKRKKLEQLIAKRTLRSYTRKIAVAGSTVRHILEGGGMKVSDFSKVSNFFNDGRMMSKEIFSQSILQEISDTNLRSRLIKYLDYSLLPVKIKKVEKTGQLVPMFDISVKRQNFIANGILVHNSQQRFARLREIAASEFYDRIAEIVNNEFLSMGSELKGILVGGPGQTKDTFVNGNYVNNQLKEKIKATQDMTYTDEFGLRELIEKSRDVLAESAITQEREIVQNFLKILATQPTKVAYGRTDVQKVLEYSAVDKLLLSESLPDAVFLQFEELAEKTGAQLFVISLDTSEGAQLRDLGGVAALLRFSVGE